MPQSLFTDELFDPENHFKLAFEHGAELLVVLEVFLLVDTACDLLMESVCDLVDPIDERYDFKTQLVSCPSLVLQVRILHEVVRV